MIQLKVSNGATQAMGLCSQGERGGTLANHRCLCARAYRRQWIMLSSQFGTPTPGIGYAAVSIDVFDSFGWELDTTNLGRKLEGEI